MEKAFNIGWKNQWLKDVKPFPQGILRAGLEVAHPFCLCLIGQNPGPWPQSCSWALETSTCVCVRKNDLNMLASSLSQAATLKSRTLHNLDGRQEPNGFVVTMLTENLWCDRLYSGVLAVFSQPTNNVSQLGSPRKGALTCLGLEANI